MPVDEGLKQGENVECVHVAAALEYKELLARLVKNQYLLL